VRNALAYYSAVEKDLQNISLTSSKKLFLLRKCGTLSDDNAPYRKYLERKKVRQIKRDRERNKRRKKERAKTKV
jgi:hypothetical protein